MAAQTPLPERGRQLRCDHCGRGVCETSHTRGDYRVDFYSMHTGDVEECSMSLDDGERTRVYQKLLRPVEIVTCSDCYRDPEMRRRREREFRREGAEQGVTA
jgi:hypothetical protein